MIANVITLEDLEKLKREILDEIQNLFFSRQPVTPVRKWLRSTELRKILGLSPGTLQNLRLNGTLPFSKVQGVIYYDYEDVRKMLETHKHHPLFTGKHFELDDFRDEKIVP